MKKETWKKVFKILGVIVISIIVLVLILFAVVTLAYNHRSKPKDVIHYETNNPHIAGYTYISAHRAGAGIMPEETLMAFKNCIEAPDFDVDYFEFDLHITKDGVLVLLHDDMLDRTSDAEKVFGKTGIKAEDYTYEELRVLNMGAKFVDKDGGMPFSNLEGNAVPDDLRILALNDLFDYLEPIKPFHYIIEIKNGGELGMKGVDILYQTIVERGMLDRVAFGTFHGEVSDYKDEKYPDMIRGAYKSEVIDFYIASVLDKDDFDPPYRVLQLPFNDKEEDSNVNLGTARVINYAHKHNIAIQFWTINDPDDIEYLISINADCIMSDYPDLAYQIRESMN